MKKYNMNYIGFIVVIVILIIIIVYMYFYKQPVIVKSSNKLIITDDMVRDKYQSLITHIGKPTYIERNGQNQMKSATWMAPLYQFGDFGKYHGCDYIKIEGFPAKKYHPHEAIVFLIIGKYIHVPDHLMGPLKYASETINIEQLFVPRSFQLKYAKTGIKDIALLTGSCASVTISAITVQFAMDMIKKYGGQTNKCLELYEEFRKEYDRRIDDYLCGKGITDKISWFDPRLFGEESKYYIGDEKCKK